MFIAQAFKYEHSFWRYLVIPILFFGLMALNYVAVEMLDLDVNEMMRQQIESKGSNRVLFENLLSFLVFLAASTGTLLVAANLTILTVESLFLFTFLASTCRWMFCVPIWPYHVTHSLVLYIVRNF